MKKALTDNIGLKILAIVIAVVVWIAVVEINDPDTTATFDDVPVIMENENALTDEGLVYKVLDNTNMVDLKVSAPRSVLSELDVKDFSVIADFSKRNSNDTVTFIISVKNYSYSSKISNIVPDHDSLRIKIENLITRDIVVDLETSGTPMSGYAVGTLKAEPDHVSISGPQSVVEKIEKLKATVDVKNCNKNIQTNCRVVALDEKNKEIDKSRLTFSDEDILVSAEVFVTKALDLKFETSGIPAVGYGVINIEAKPSTVTISGRTADLVDISSISIPSQELDITDLDSDLTKTINIEQYLPENVKVESTDGGNVKVKVIIKKLSERIIEVPVTSVTVKNLKSGLSYSFVNETGKELSSVPIRIKGLKEDLDDISAADIKLVLDAKNLGIGKQQIQAEITVPSGMQVDETWVSLYLSK